jgi:DNA-binding NarL/FixJ family response regulator
MPQVNGLQVASVLRHQQPRPKIVFLSMHDSQSYRVAARELGARGYVGKGDFVADLVPLIESIALEMKDGSADFADTTGGAL